MRGGETEGNGEWESGEKGIRYWGEEGWGRRETLFMREVEGGEREGKRKMRWVCLDFDNANVVEREKDRTSMRRKRRRWGGGNRETEKRMRVIRKSYCGFGFSLLSN